MMRPLNFRQRLFVEYYLGESKGSAVDAARRAGYRWPEKLGPRLVERCAIGAAIDARVETAAIAAKEVLARIADVATSDLLNFIKIDANGGWKVDLDLVKQLGLGHLIKRLRKNKDGSSEIELEARMPALVKLGEYQKLWKGEAQSQVTLVELLDEIDRMQSEEQADKTGERLSETTGPVQ